MSFINDVIDQGQTVLLITVLLSLGGMAFVAFL